MSRSWIFDSEFGFLGSLVQFVFVFCLLVNVFIVFSATCFTSVCISFFQHIPCVLCVYLILHIILLVVCSCAMSFGLSHAIIRFSLAVCSFSSPMVLVRLLFHGFCLQAPSASLVFLCYVIYFVIFTAAWLITCLVHSHLIPACFEFAVGFTFSSKPYKKLVK